MSLLCTEFNSSCPFFEENKITKDNAWDLNIIDYMPSLVETLSQDEHFNFQKTSVALHASAQVRHQNSWHQNSWHQNSRHQNS